MSLTIGIDTSGRGGAVALAREGELLAEVRHDPALGYAEELFGLLDQALREAGVDRDDIEAVAVVRGPGSFTGLRIGVMTAKTLARARDWTLFAADTLDVVAAAAPDAERVLAIAPAGGGQWWSAVYAPAAGGAEREIEMPSLRADPANTLKRAEGATVILGADPSLVAEVGETHRVEVAPLAATLARCASAQRWPAQPSSPLELLPHYAALSQAERVHDIDLADVVNRPLRPRSWGSE